MEALTLFQLGPDHTDAGRWNFGPLDAVVGGLYYIDRHSTLHVPAGFLTNLREAPDNAFKGRLRLEREKAFQQGSKGSKVSMLIKTSV